MMRHEEALRASLIELLEGGSAHLSLDRAVAGLPISLRGAKVPPVPHTPWRLLEHIRIAQWDILEFSQKADHESPAYPEGYWPEGDKPPDAAAWGRSVEAVEQDLQTMQGLVANPSTDLFTPIPHGDGQTVLREALLLADHNAYHLGQLVVIRRALLVWPD